LRGGRRLEQANTEAPLGLFPERDLGLAQGVSGSFLTRPAAGIMIKGKKMREGDMKKTIGLEGYLRAILIINGIGDIGLGAFMLFLPGELARMVSFDLTGEIIYLVGGWGTASMSFGVMRLIAGMNSQPEIRWFVAAFGLFEGALLAVFGLAVMALTPLTFHQVSLSTLFALFFAVAYGAAFLRRRKSNRPV